MPKIKISVFQAKRMIYQRNFDNDEKGINESIRFLEDIKEEHFSNPYSFLFPEMEKAKMQVMKYNNLIPYDTHHLVIKAKEKLKWLQYRREEYLKIDAIEPIGHLEVKIERI